MTPRLLTGSCNGAAATVRYEEDAGYRWLRVSYGLTKESFEVPALRTLDVVPVPGRGLVGYTGLQCAALVIGGVIAMFTHRWLLGTGCVALGLGWFGYRASRPKHALVLADAHHEVVIVLDDGAVDAARTLVAARGAPPAELPVATLER